MISTDTEKAFNKIQHQFIIIFFNKLGTEGYFLNLIKDIYGKPTSNIIISPVYWKLQNIAEKKLEKI